MDKKLSVLEVVTAVLLVVIVGFALWPKDKKLGANIPLSVSTISNTSSTVGANTAFTVKILAQLTGASVRSCTNMGAVPAFLSMNSTSTAFVAKTGYMLLPSSTITMSEGAGNYPLWLGNVWALTESGTTTVSCQQY